MTASRVVIAGAIAMGSITRDAMAAEFASRGSDTMVDIESIRGNEFTRIDIDEVHPADNSENFLPPKRCSNDPKSPDYLPHCVRLGVRVDGVERNDVAFYDVDKLQYMTTAKTSHLATSIEPYWRYAESRQQRRARQRWEGKRK